MLKTPFTGEARAEHSSVVCFNFVAKPLRREGAGPLFGVRVSEADAPEEQAFCEKAVIIFNVIST